MPGRDPKPYADPERPDAARRRPSAARSKPSDSLPAAGPHADPALTNPDATPGAGALTPPGEHDEVDSTSG
jgi:hypothetical protein